MFDVCDALILSFISYIFIAEHIHLFSQEGPRSLDHLPKVLALEAVAQVVLMVRPWLRCNLREVVSPGYDWFVVSLL